MKEWPGGYKLVMQRNPIVPGDIPLMSIIYKYRYKKVLVFSSTEGSGSTEPGVPDLSPLPDNYSNTSIRPVICPCVIGRYFSAFNVIYNHNKMCQYDLSPEKYWLIQSGYFRLATTVALGMGVIDGNLLLCHGTSKQIKDNNFSMRYYNDRTVYDWFNNNFSVDCGIPDLNTPPIAIDDIHLLKKYPDIPLIRFQITFLFSLETMLVFFFHPL